MMSFESKGREDGFQESGQIHGHEESQKEVRRPGKCTREAEARDSWAMKESNIAWA